jgi:hypothetical protein
VTGSQADRRPFDYGIEVRIVGGRGRHPVLRTNMRLAFSFVPRVPVQRDFDCEGLIIGMAGDASRLSSDRATRRVQE